MQAPQRIKLSEATAALRRVYFDAEDVTAPGVPLDESEMDIGGAGSFTATISKNGGSATTPVGNTITEIDATGLKGAFYIELATGDLNTEGVLLVYIKSSGGPDNMIPRCIPVQVWTDTWGSTVLESGVTRDDAMRIGLRTNTAKFSKVGNDYVFRDIADTKDSHHGTVTTAGRIDADIDDAT